MRYVYYENQELHANVKVYRRAVNHTIPQFPLLTSWEQSSNYSRIQKFFKRITFARAKQLEPYIENIDKI